MAGRMYDTDSYNRIFIIGPKDCDQDEVREAFEKFGHVSDVYIPREKGTRESKGVIYVTFSKASEAALAIEEMNGKGFLKGSSRPLKVVLASSKSQGSVRDPNEDEKMLRLFIVVPSSYKEADIREEFQKYGEVDSVRLVKDRRSGEFRGLAYVKFRRAYDAAVALETCPSSFKAVFAETPKPKGYQENVSNEREHRRPVGALMAPHAGMMPPSDVPMMDYSSKGRADYASGSSASAELLHCYPHNGQNIIEASFHTYVTADQVSRLFDIVPGLDCCNYDSTTGKAYVKYSCPQAAAYARDKIDCLEYPPGYRVGVKFIKDNTSYGYDPLSAAADPSMNVQSLVQSIQKATVLLQQAGLGMVPATPSNSYGGGFGGSGGYGSNAYGTNSYGTGGYGAYGSTLPAAGFSAAGGSGDTSQLCSVPLPDKQPILPRDTPVAQRLFIVSHEPFDEQILEDVFCRFGNLIGAYFMRGKTYGYVKYATAESAVKAMDTLHGKTVCGSKLKVLPAEPQRNERKSADEGLKRDYVGRERDWDERRHDDDGSPREKHSRFN